jgi:hypothetical protein
LHGPKVRLTQDREGPGPKNICEGDVKTTREVVPATRPEAAERASHSIDSFA